MERIGFLKWKSVLAWTAVVLAVAGSVAIGLFLAQDDGNNGTTDVTTNAVTPPVDATPLPFPEGVIQGELIDEDEQWIKSFGYRMSLSFATYKDNISDDAPDVRGHLVRYSSDSITLLTERYGVITIPLDIVGGGGGSWSPCPPDAWLCE